jgi:16S rRNA (guanine966-N2)-methyltransferase
VREAVFASLGAATADASVLDLYAGTGAMAVEALSRGAARAVLVERDRRAAAVCRQNLATTGFASRGRVVEDAVERFLHRAPPPEAPFDLVCCDPPYGEPDASVSAVLDALARPAWTGRGALVVVERPVASALVAPVGWRLRFARAYGDTLVHLLETGGPDPVP